VAKENLVPESLKKEESSPDKGGQGQEPGQPSHAQS
jgi:hypothetical protein